MRQLAASADRTARRSRSRRSGSVEPSVAGINAKMHHVGAALANQLPYRTRHRAPRTINYLLGTKSGILTHTWCCASLQPKGETNDEMQTDWRGRGRFFCAGRTRDGPASNLPSSLPCAEHLLCHQGSGKSPQQVLRLHRLEQMATARRLGQHARQCLLAQPQLCTGRMQL
jgi:hypothetical protein